MKKDFWLFLRGKRHALLFFTLCAACFSTVLMLYGLPAEAILYAAALTGCLAVVLLTFEACQERRKKKAIALARREPRLEPELLPSPDDSIEAEYRALVVDLIEANAATLERYETRADDRMEYYTMWVHQIKTPIAAMRLLLGDEDSEGRRQLSCELFSVEQYVDMALNYLRLDSPAFDLVIRECDLDSLVRQTVRSYSTLFIQKKLKFDFRPSGIRVLTDEKWFIFLLGQILSNALKYTREGGIALYVVPDKTLVVEDTGIGIRAEDLPRIFEKGFTGCNGRREHRSTGIGLYLCRRIAEKLGHRLSVASEPGKGTRVSIDLSDTELEVE